MKRRWGVVLAGPTGETVLGWCWTEWGAEHWAARLNRRRATFIVGHLIRYYVIDRTKVGRGRRWA